GASGACRVVIVHCTVVHVSPHWPSCGVRSNTENHATPVWGPSLYSGPMVAADGTYAEELTKRTHEGDSGRTTLGGHGELSKADARVAAYADCDEANAAVSVVIAGGALPNHVTTMLASVQNDLFDLVTDLSHPVGAEADARIQQAHIERLE